MQTCDDLCGIDSGFLRGPGLTLGFCGDSIVLKPSAGPSIVNALKQNRSVSIAGAGRVKSVEHIRAGVLGGVVCSSADHCSSSSQHFEAYE